MTKRPPNQGSGGRPLSEGGGEGGPGTFARFGHLLPQQEVRDEGSAGRGLMTPDQRDTAMIAARLLPVFLTITPRPHWLVGADALSASVNAARQIVELVKSKE